MKINKYQKIAFTLVIIILPILLLYNYFENIACYLFGDSINYHGELFKLLLSCIGGIFIIYGLFLNARRTKALETQNIINDKGAINERFKNAIDHLGSDKNSIILGGIHSLHRIASEDSSYTSTVFDILCSYIKENTQKPDIIVNEELGKDGFNEPKIVIQTIIDLIFKAKSIDEYLYKSLPSTFKGCHFERYDFGSAFLINSIFNECYFNDAYMSFSNIRNSLFIKSKFDHTKFEKCTLNNTIIFNSTFESCEMKGINFSNCTLKSSKFKEGIYSNSTFKDTKFESSDISNIDFDSSTFINTEFIEVRIFKTEFNKSYFNNISFFESQIITSKLMNIKMFKSSISSSSIKQSNFNGSKIINGIWSDVEINYIKLEECFFDFAEIRNVTINNSKLFEHYFYGEKLENLKFINCKVSIKYKLNSRSSLITKENCEIIELS